MIPAAPILLSVAAMIAGHPTEVRCDTDVNPGPITPPPGFVVEAWTTYDTGPVHMSPDLCTGITARPGSITFAQSLRVIIHESAHAKGYRREACAEMTADIGVYDVLRRLWGIQFFTPLSVKIGAQVLALTRLRPVNYQPESCWGTFPS